MLHRIAIGRSFPKQHRVSIANDGATPLGHEMRKPVLPHAPSASLQVVRLKRFTATLIRGVDAPANMVSIDRQHWIHVGVIRWTNEYFDRIRKYEVLGQGDHRLSAHRHSRTT